MSIDDIIKSRKTQKVLAEQEWDIPSNQEITRKTIHDLLELAAAAPYHKKSHEDYGKKGQLDSCLPWRCYTLDTKNCRKLLKHIENQNIKAGKISNMLAAADALLMVTWLPEPSKKQTSKKEEVIPFEGNLKNMEHIAACSAAIQNILIGATAREIPNYWSTGGQLRNAPLRDYLDISLNEILMGALFLFPKNSEERGAKIKLGSLRDQGKKISSWAKWVNLT